GPDVRCIHGNRKGYIVFDVLNFFLVGIEGKHLCSLFGQSPGDGRTVSSDTDYCKLTVVHSFMLKPVPGRQLNPLHLRFLRSIESGTPPHRFFPALLSEWTHGSLLPGVRSMIAPLPVIQPAQKSALSSPLHERLPFYFL